MDHAVFISYSSRDQSLADAVCTRFESAAITCWIAPRDPAPGLPYGQQIVRAIAACRVVLLVFSAHSNASRAVLGEIELASNRGKIILPLRVEDIAPSEQLEFYIRSVHWHNALEAPVEAHLEGLTARVRDLLATSTADSTLTPPADFNQQAAAMPAGFDQPAPALPAGFDQPAPVLAAGFGQQAPATPASSDDAAPQAAIAIPAAQLARLTAQLATYVGPVARVLVARQARKTADFTALRDALGAEISDPIERAKFIAATATSARPGWR